MRVRDLLFIEDLMDAFLLTQSNLQTLSGQAFNIGGGLGNTASLLGLLDLIENLHGEKPPARFKDWRPGDQRYYVSDTRKFKKATSKISTVEITEKLIRAKHRVPFVQANLLDSDADAPDELERWRDLLRQQGIWANEPVPLCPYPGSPDCTRRWGAPDDQARERAHEFYLTRFDQFSDMQDQRPLPLVQLEVS